MRNEGVDRGGARLTVNAEAADAYTSASVVI